ncbi:UNVERIFIED_CONTAM: hypothetical protein PYX00_003448 [Menopon gallinae]|uniref:Kinase n=1 Tax=Menopon gallinae TaxID=328185 RepID=A0AAW2I028_9NEOP
MFAVLRDYIETEKSNYCFSGLEVSYHTRIVLITCMADCDTSVLEESVQRLGGRPGPVDEHNHSEHDAKMIRNLEDVNQNIVLTDATPLECQVAGHSFRKGSSVGMLCHKDGYVLKSVTAQDEKGEREIKFYEEVQNSIDPLVKELKKFLPRYYGITHFRLNKENLKWIVLENVTHGFVQPCVMDIKIGFQTWDPLATEEKRLSEEKKYRESKRDVGFCIPGFHVYKLSTGEHLKFDREYGKTLNGETVRTSLRTFLNAECGLSRTLVLQLLTKLWKILRWFRMQRKYKFYSSSLLLAYDAVKLKRNAKSQFVNGANSPAVGRHGSSSPSCSQSPSTPGTPPIENWHTMFDNVCRTHSLVNNYEKDLETKRENYRLLLRDLVGCSGTEPNEEWVNVHMIDFAHVFHSNSEDLDNNYLIGLQNLVNIFEEFLVEAHY